MKGERIYGNENHQTSIFYPCLVWCVCVWLCMIVCCLFLCIFVVLYLQHIP